MWLILLSRQFIVAESLPTGYTSMVMVNFSATLFGLLEPTESAIWLLTALALLWLCVIWLRAANRLWPTLPLATIWLYLPLAAVTTLALFLATTLPAILLSWSVLLLTWTAVALRLLDPDLIWGSGWLWPLLWPPLAALGVMTAVMPMPDPFYAEAHNLAFSIQILVGIGLLLPCVCWPLWGWQPLTDRLSRPMALLLLLWPALAAAVPFVRWVWAAGNLWLTLLLILLSILFVGSQSDRLKQILARQNIGLPLTSLRAILTSWGRKLSQSFYDALLLLEGEAGLLWLLGLLVLALLFN
jgi:hypothetical protein